MRSPVLRRLFHINRRLQKSLPCDFSQVHDKCISRLPVSRAYKCFSSRQFLFWLLHAGQQEEHNSNNKGGTKLRRGAEPNQFLQVPDTVLAVTTQSTFLYNPFNYKLHDLLGRCDLVYAVDVNFVSGIPNRGEMIDRKGALGIVLQNGYSAVHGR